MDKKHSLGISSLLASTVLFAGMGTLVKVLHTQGIDSYKVALFRFAIGISLLGTLAMFKKIKLEFHNSGILFLRGLFGGIAVYLYILSIYKIGLAKGTVISSSAPIFATIGSILFLGEKSSLKKWGLVLLAVFGIVLIAAAREGDLSGFGLWEGLAVVGAITAGGAYVTIKKLSTTDSPYAIFLAQSLIGFWLVITPANLIPCRIGIGGGVILLVMGLTAASGQLLMTYGFKFVTVSTGSLLGFLTTVINVFIGILIFKEKIGLIGIVGSAMVITACVLIITIQKEDTPAPRPR
ncbi:DMT family transporter [Planctomycetota bacterium]